MYNERTAWRKLQEPTLPSSSRSSWWIRNRKMFKIPNYEHFLRVSCESRDKLSFNNSVKWSTPQCFYCSRYGHIAKFCDLKHRRNVSQQSDSNKKKSERKRARDIKRLLQYREKKSVCAMFPFYDSSDEEIRKCVPKCVMQVLKRPAATRSSLKDVTNTTAELLSENNRLKDEVSQLITKTNTQAETIQTLEDKLKEAEDKCEKTTKMWMEKMSKFEKDAQFELIALHGGCEWTLHQKQAECERLTKQIEMLKKIQLPIYTGDLSVIRNSEKQIDNLLMKTNDYLDDRTPSDKIGRSNRNRKWTNGNRNDYYR